MTTRAALPEIAIEAHGLVQDFGRFRAVDRVSFQVRQGEIFGLLGANGAGKTTIIKMLTGILPLTSGAGSVAGANMHRAGREIKERIGYMSQAFSLYRDLTALENLRLYAGIYGLSRAEARERVAWVLGMAGLTGHENTHTDSLPMGVRQRLALGCALVHRPRILFLDEPTSGVDPVGRREIWDILFHLSREEGVAILLTTHHMSEAERCDHLVLLFDGRVIADSSPQAMEQDAEAEAGQLLDLHTDRPGDALPLLAQHGLPEAALFGNRIHVLSRDPAADTRRIRALLGDSHIALRDISRIPFTMEDVFVYRVTALENAAQAGMLVLLIIMPIVVLSGTFTPRDSMPAALNAVMALSPLRHYIEIAYGILLRGAGMETLWSSILGMLLLIGVFFAWGMGRFRRQLE
jgi:ABC-2 type transport system ATP-binding protein